MADFSARHGVENKIEVYRVFNAQATAASGTSTSDAIDLHCRSGYFSLQVAITGDGTCKFEYLISNDGVNFIEPSSASDIASSKVKTSGPGSDGKDIFSFTPVISRFIKIRITETGGANSVTVTAHLAIQ